jgi:hypothetical protein
MIPKLRRMIRRVFRINQADNLVVRVIGKPPLELLAKIPCPVCGGGWYDCGHLNHYTLDQLAMKGFARYVEQV